MADKRGDWLPSGEEKRGGYSGSTPAKQVPPPPPVPSGTIKVPPKEEKPPASK
jgi:hypothetical protein